MHQNVACPKKAKSAMAFHSPLYSEPNHFSTPVLIFSIKFPVERFCLWEKKSWMRYLWFWTIHQEADRVKNPRKAFIIDYWRDSYTSFAINTDVNFSCETLILKRSTSDIFGWTVIQVVRCVKILTILDIQRWHRFWFLPRIKRIFCHN